MLELLHIENIAIIERADILFGRGFNALTGETGAGKSIVIDARGARPAHVARAHPHGRGEGVCQRDVQRGPGRFAGARRKRLYAGGGRNAFIAARAGR